MFGFSYVLMNRSIDKWFSRPVEELREDSAQVAGLLTNYAACELRTQKRSRLSQGRTIRQALTTGNYSEVDGVSATHASQSTRWVLSHPQAGPADTVRSASRRRGTQLRASLDAPVARYLGAVRAEDATTGTCAALTKRCLPLRHRRRALPGFGCRCRSPGPSHCGSPAACYPYANPQSY